MRKIFLVIGFFLSVISVLAQNNFSVEAGTGISWIDNSIKNNQEWSVKPVLSYTVGASYSLALNEKAALKIGASYAKLGGDEFTVVRFNPTTDRRVEFDLNSSSFYIQVPLILDVSINDFILNAGLVPSFFISGKVDEHAAEYNTDNQLFRTNDRTDDLNLNSFDIGPRLGFGYGVSDVINIGISYFHGLQDTEQFGDIDGITSNTQKNRQALLGVSYLLKGK